MDIEITEIIKKEAGTVVNPCVIDKLPPDVVPVPPEIMAKEEILVPESIAHLNEKENQVFAAVADRLRSGSRIQVRLELAVILIVRNGFERNPERPETFLPRLSAVQVKVGERAEISEVLRVKGIKRIFDPGKSKLTKHLARLKNHPTG
jgi:hypothetical protein